MQRDVHIDARLVERLPDALERARHADLAVLDPAALVVEDYSQIETLTADRFARDQRASELALRADVAFKVGSAGDVHAKVELSGGQRKRVAMAQVLALKPRLLLMDEPFASLDAIVRHRITEDLLGWVEHEHLTVLLVTHDLEEAQVLSDVVYLLSQGPRARVRERYEIPIPRPRDLVKSRMHPSFNPLLERLWRDLSEEVGGAEVSRTPHEIPQRKAS